MRCAWPHLAHAPARDPAVPARRADRTRRLDRDLLRAGAGDAARGRAAHAGRWRPRALAFGLGRRPAPARADRRDRAQRRGRRRRIAGRPRHHRPRHRPDLRGDRHRLHGRRAARGPAAVRWRSRSAPCSRRPACSSTRPRTRTARSSSRRCSRSGRRCCSASCCATARGSTSRCASGRGATSAAAPPRPRRRRSEERTRIASELHDVVAHALSAMTVQAGAARRLSDARPRRARATRSPPSRRTGREALTELRRLLGVLRKEDEELALAPQPSLANVDGLARRATASGLPVELTVHGAAAPAPRRRRPDRVPGRAGGAQRTRATPASPAARPSQIGYGDEHVSLDVATTAPPRAAGCSACASASPSTAASWRARRSRAAAGA